MVFPIDGLIGVKLDENVASPSFAVGTRVRTNDGQEYVYVQDSGSGITQYQAVGVDEDWGVSALTTANALAGHMVGFAQTALTADYYGWIAVLGPEITGKFNAAVSADTQLYTTSTAGSLDDAGTTGLAKLMGVVADTALTAAGNTTVIIRSYIFTDGAA